MKWVLSGFVYVLKLFLMVVLCLIIVWCLINVGGLVLDDLVDFLDVGWF